MSHKTKKNLLYHSRIVSDCFNKDIRFNSRDLRKIFKEEFTKFDKEKDMIFVEFREILSNLFNSGDSLIIKGNKIYYRDYNDFDWSFGDNVKYTGGLTNLLKSTSYKIKKISKGHLVIDGLGSSKDYIFHNIQDFWDNMYDLPDILIEVCFNIYYYEYIIPIGTVNLYSYFQKSKTTVTNIISDYISIYDIFKLNETRKDMQKYLVASRLLKERGYIW